MDCLGNAVHAFVSPQLTVGMYHPSFGMRIASYVVAGYGRIEVRAVEIGLKLQFMITLLTAVNPVTQSTSCVVLLQR